MRAEDALLQAKSYVKKTLEGAGALKGEPGKNGVSPVIEMSKSGKVTTITITDAEGVKTATINDGNDGANSGSGESGNYTIDVVDYSTLTGTSFELYPNKVYKLGSRDSVTINFMPPEDETALSLYSFSMVGGEGVVTPIFQRDGVEITIDKGTTEFVAGGKYEFSYNWADEILIAQ